MKTTFKLARSESMNIMKSTSNAMSLNEADSDESFESKLLDQAVETRRSLRRQRSKLDSKSLSTTKTTTDENQNVSSRSSGSQAASVQTMSTARTRHILSENNLDDSGVLIFRRGLIEFLILKSIEFYQNQVKFL